MILVGRNETSCISNLIAHENKLKAYLKKKCNNDWAFSETN